MSRNLAICIAILLLAVSLAGGATTAWFTGQAAVTPNVFHVVIEGEPGTESAWGDGKLYHGTARYFDFKKCRLRQAGGQQVDLVQGRENKTVLDGKVRAWIIIDQGKEVLFVEITTGSALSIEETHVYAGLASAGLPPQAPGQFNSKDPIMADTHRSLHRIESVVSSSGFIEISDLPDSAVLRIAAHAVVIIY